MINDDRFLSKRIKDNRLYEEAFDDLLSVLGISSSNGEKVKGAVSRILKYMGEPIPEVPEEVISITEQIEYILRPSGTMKRKIELVGKWWKDCYGCILASNKKGEVFSIFPSKFGGYFYFDKTGKKIKINEKTSSNFEVDAFCFYKSFPLKSIKIKDLIKFMIQNISSVDIIFILSICAVIQALGMIIPYITNVIYNIVVPSSSISLLQAVFCTYFGITIGRLSLNMMKNVIKTRIQYKLSLSVNSAIMIRLFSLPTRFFADYSAGDLSNRIGHVATLCETISSIFFSSFLSTIFSFAYIFQMVSQASCMVAPSLSILFCSLLFSVLMINFRQKISIKKIKLEPKLQSFVFNIFNGIQKIKIFGAEKRAFSIWAKNYSEVQKLNYNIPNLIKIAPVISTIISSTGTIILYWVAAKNKVPIANYMSFNVAYGAVSSAVSILSDTIGRISNLKPIFEIVEPFLTSKPEITPNGKIVHSLSGEIEINNVVFRYKKNSDPIINNLTMNIKKGEYVAIVGKTGCGKSTLLRLLLGFETPERGGIYFDQIDINTLDKRSLRQKIGVVMQNGSIFQGDIFSNIIVTSPWKTMDDAWEAARMAGLEQDIEDMPMGMHTLISEGSGGISGGQKQRLMIARALISKPRILFFDEATSALDNITQKIVSDNIDKLRCTRIVIAHRLSTVKNCDRIFVIDKGQIAEEGKFDNLMERKGLFYNLVIRQLS